MLFCFTLFHKLKNFSLETHTESSFEHDAYENNQWTGLAIVQVTSKDEKRLMQKWGFLLCVALPTMISAVELL